MHAHLEGAICKPGSELSPGTTPTSKLLLGFPSSRSGRNKNKMLLMDRSVYCQMILCYCRGQRHTWALGLYSPLPSCKTQEFYLSHYSYSVPLWGIVGGHQKGGKEKAPEEKLRFTPQQNSLDEKHACKLLASPESTRGEATVSIASLAAMIKYPGKTYFRKEGLPLAHSWRLQSTMMG